MKNWKVRAAAMGMAAVVMAPGMAYGHSKDMECNVKNAYQQIQNIKVCYETCLKEGTYCRDWSQLFNQWKQSCQKPGTEIPGIDVPKPDVPETDAPEISVPGQDTPEVNIPDQNVPEQDAPEENVPDTETKPEGDNSGNQQNASAVAKEMLAQVNKERRAAGLSELTLSTQLSEVAQVKAEDMRDQGYFSHTSPTYGSPFDMMKKFGVSYRSAGENIAKGYRSVSAVMNGWMNSSGHKANILNGGFTQLGVGYCTDGSGNGYWVQMFIG